MRHKSRWIVAATLLGWLIPGQALCEPSQAPAALPAASGAPVQLRLDEAIGLALRNNYSIRTAYVARIAQKFDFLTEQRRFSPVFSLDARVEQRLGHGEAGRESSFSPSAFLLTPTGARARFRWEHYSGAGNGDQVASLEVAQPLLRGGGLRVNQAPVEIARWQETINQLELASTISRTVTSVILAYRQLLQAQQQLRLAKAGYERSLQFLEASQSLIDAGRVAAAELVLARSDTANQKVAILQAEHQIALARVRLLNLLSIDLRINVAAADPVAADRVEIDIEKSLELGQNRSRDLLMQKQRLEQERQALLVAKNNSLWDLSVTGRIRDVHGKVGAPDLWSKSDQRIGLELSIPIGDYALKQSVVRAETAVRTNELRLEDMQLNTEAAIRDAVASVEFSWRRVEASREARLLAERTLELQKEKFRAGRASSFEVLSYEANLRAADSQALLAEIDYMNALTILDEQLGTTLDTWQIALND